MIFLKALWLQHPVMVATQYVIAPRGLQIKPSTTNSESKTHKQAKVINNTTYKFGALFIWKGLLVSAPLWLLQNLASNEVLRLVRDYSLIANMTVAILISKSELLIFVPHRTQNMNQCSPVNILSSLEVLQN